MWLTRFALTRPTVTIAIFAALVIFGVISFLQLGRSSSPPNTDFPIVVVAASYPGASPQDMERMVIKPIEDQMAGIDNLDEISANAQEGSAVVVVQFKMGTDLNLAAVDVQRRADVARAWRYGDAALVEEYIPGRELTVGVMGDRALAVTEIIADAGVFYDYESKYADGGSRHIIPARVHPEMYDRALDIALQAHRALGCRGATRCDFRYDDTDGEPGRLVLLEINTQPGLTPTSLLPEQAAHLGIDFPALCAWMVEQAACRA